MGEHPAATFVRAYHATLTEWFSGAGDRKRVWSRLEEGTPANMTLVYPSGERLDGSAFLESVRGAWGQSPGFDASITNLELVHEGANHVVVAYVELQRGARQSASINARSALALIVRDGGSWKWRFVQETAQ